MTTIPSYFSIAPMLKWTHYPFRYYARLLSKKAWLYTEMISVDAFLNNARLRIPPTNEEHPIAIQFAGADAAKLAKATQIASELNYDEINLNAGCPSERMQAYQSGAFLFKDAEKTAHLLRVMGDHSNKLISIKTRVGVDDCDSEDYLLAFTHTLLTKSGVSKIILHARKAWLKGVNPRKNRTLPVLNYDRVVRCKQAYPHVAVVLNGGLSLEEALQWHQTCRLPTMLGRAILENPWLLASVDSRFYQSEDPCDSLDTFLKEADTFLRSQSPVRHYEALTPLSNLMHQQKCAKAWKIALWHQIRSPNPSFSLFQLKESLF